MKKSLVLIAAMLACVVSVVSVTAFTSAESDAATFSGDFVC